MKPHGRAITDTWVTAQILGQKVGAKLHKLAALRILSEGIAKFEDIREQRITAGHDLVEVDRDTVQMALTCVVGFLDDCGVESGPLARLLGDIDALSNGSSPSRMLAPAATRHRRPESPTIEEVKGRLAAAMEYLQQTGMARKAAAAAVVRLMPPALRRRLKSVGVGAVDCWLVKWGGDHGAEPGSGREGYLHMRAILAQHRPSRQTLQKTLKAIERTLPA